MDKFNNLLKRLEGNHVEAPPTFESGAFAIAPQYISQARAITFFPYYSQSKWAVIMDAKTGAQLGTYPLNQNEKIYAFLDNLKLLENAEIPSCCPKTKCLGVTAINGVCKLHNSPDYSKEELKALLPSINSLPFACDRPEYATQGFVPEEGLVAKVELKTQPAAIIRDVNNISYILWRDSSGQAISWSYTQNEVAFYRTLRNAQYVQALVPTFTIEAKEYFRDIIEPLLLKATISSLVRQL